jgi:hypothetical protein
MSQSNYYLPTIGLRTSENKPEVDRLIRSISRGVPLNVSRSNDTI